MAKRIIWKVDLPPTGKYRSFGRRAWPSAHYRDEQETPAAMITCKTDYSPQKAKEKNHVPLKLFICFPTKTEEEIKKYGSFRWRAFIQQFDSLNEAKEAAENFIEKHPELWPQNNKKGE